MKVKMQYVRTDKNGTKIYHDNTCQRCGGQGAWEGWRFTGCTCYECGGTGTSKMREIKEYTPEYRAKLDEMAEKRHTKKLIAERDDRNAEFMNKYFFGNDVMFVVDLEDTFSIKDTLRELGAKWNSQIQRWVFGKQITEYPTVPVTMNEVTEQDEIGYIRFTEDVKDIVKAKMTKETKPESKHIGTVGERINLKVTVKFWRSYETMYGTSYMYNMEDAEGNIFVWFTSSSTLEENKTYTMSARVKEHGEYKGIKQTILQRATKIKEVEE